MKTLALLVPVAAFFLSSLPLSADQLPRSAAYDLLMKAARAPSVVSYHGQVTNSLKIGKKKRTVILRIEHAPGVKDRVTVILPPNTQHRPPPQSRNPGGRHRPPPGPNPLIFMGLPGMRQRLDTDLALLRRNYTFDVEAGGRIAERPTYRIKVDPKYPGRKEKVLWVDAKTGIVLKSRVVRSDGGFETISYFTRIEEDPEEWSLSPEAPSGKPTNAPPASADRSAAGHAAGPWVGLVDRADLRKLQYFERAGGFIMLSPRFLPEGFVIEGVSRIFKPGTPDTTRSAIIHVFYSDGLSSISLFLQAKEPLWPDRIRRFFFGPGRGEFSRHPRPPTGVTLVEGNRDGTRFVIVSDIATYEIQHMADSLAPVDKAGK